MKLLLLSVLILICVFKINGDEEISKINSVIYKKKHKPECAKRLNEFSDHQKDFIQCAIENGQPIKICEKCLNKFVVSNAFYKNLTENINGTNCYDHFFDQDRINVVSSIYNDGVNVWNRAYCKDCYDWQDNTINLNFSMETQNVLNHLNTTLECIHKNWGEACGYCSGKYMILNDLFISMEKQKKSQICFDLQDAMNQTRLLWSKVMKCCDERESSLLSFTLLSSTFSVIIVLFYISVPYFEIRAQSNTIQANHSGEEPQQSGSSNDSNLESYGNIITGFVMPSPTSSKIKNRENSDDSSDDEMLPNLPPHNTNLIEIADDEPVRSSKN